MTVQNIQNPLSKEIIQQLHTYLDDFHRPCYAYVHSFGCQLNVADGERIRGMLQQIGYHLTDSYENADLILFNTCAVRESAEDRVYGILGNVKRYKMKNPDLVLILCGCMASEAHTAAYVRQHYPFVDIVFGTAALSRLPHLLLTHFQEKQFLCDTNEYDTMYEGIVPAREHPFKASVPIMFGCNNFCTYCIVPYVRGRERSRQPSQILAEIRHLVENGYREIMLLGQNVNSYGKDLENPMSFAKLLRLIEEIPGDFVVRFMSSHPKDASKELLDVILNSNKIGHHLHLPVQSGSDEILSAMNRRYTIAQYLEIVDYLRQRDSDFSLTTDLIVGFPNESSTDFQATLELLQRVRYDNVYTFIYSKRKGTKAAEMTDVTPDAEKKARMEQLLSLQREIASENYRRFVGRTLRVLVDGTSKKEGYLIGKDSAFIIVEFPGDASLIGKFVQVKITKSKNWAVEGELVSTTLNS